MTFLNENEKRVLEVENRRTVYDAVRRFAGSHFREIERKSGLQAGTVKYHLSYLAKHGIIKEEKDKNNIRYFPLGFSTSDRQLMTLLRQESVRKILLFIITHKNCNHEHIVAYVRLSPSTVTWHLKKLEKRNIIGFMKKGRNTFYTLLADREEIYKLLVTYQASFFDTLVDNIIETWS